MKTFEPGKTYRHNWAGDSDFYTSWTVISRTPKTIKITDGKETKTCRISAETSEILNAESVYPFGRYSMAPILSADCPA